MDIKKQLGDLAAQCDKPMNIEEMDIDVEMQKHIAEGMTKEEAIRKVTNDMDSMLEGDPRVPQEFKAALRKAASEVDIVDRMNALTGLLTDTLVAATKEAYAQRSNPLGFTIGAVHMRMLLTETFQEGLAHPTSNAHLRSVAAAVKRLDDHMGSLLLAALFSAGESYAHEQNKKKKGT